MEKKRIGLFVFSIILSIFILNLISAAAPAAGTCAIVPRADCVASNGNYILMGLASTTNSHGELAQYNQCTGTPTPCSSFTTSTSCFPHAGCWWNPGSKFLGITLAAATCTGTPLACNQIYDSTSCTNQAGCLWSIASGNYPDVLCCSGGSGNTNCASDGSNKILGLSDVTNAHAESPSQSNYPPSDNVCYGDFSCITTTSSSCTATYPVATVSLTAVTNAHIGGINDYPVKICCKGTLTPTSCILNAAGSTANWGTSEAIVGSVVGLKIHESVGCAGKSVSVQIKKHGLVDSNVGSPFTVTLVTDNVNGGAVGTSSWTVPSSAVKGDKYYFVATASNPSSSVTSNDLLIMDPNFCNTISTCSGYTAQADCSSDSSLCAVANTEVNGIMQDSTFCSTHSCSCSWNSATNVCGSTWGNPVGSVCGNGIQEAGEQCDLGAQNGQPCSACSSTCTYTAIDPNQCGGGCPEGTTLCSDGTCSSNCVHTDTDPSSNGCSNPANDNQQDHCNSGLSCSLIGGGNNPACCNTVSDGVCNLLCASVDPDCIPSVGSCTKDSDCNSGAKCISGVCEITPTSCTGVTCPTGYTCNSGICASGSGTPCTTLTACPSGEICNNGICVTNGGGSTGAPVCGNGKVEFGEQCDLGAQNNATGTGCDTSCKLYEVAPINGNQCPEGTIMCNDGQCSLNCYKTDAGVKKCDQGGCICAQSPVLLTYSEIDQACCNPISDGVCNPYCTYMDPDCTNQQNLLQIGSCKITQSVEKDCDTEPKGYKTLTWTGVWNPAPGASDTGAAHDLCVAGGKVTVPCPALIQLPFFDYLELIGSALVIAFVYVGLIFRRKFKR